MSTNKNNSFLAYDFAQTQLSARERVLQRFMAAQAEQPRFTLVTDDEGMDISDEALEMLAAAGDVFVNPEDDEQ